MSWDMLGVRGHPVGEQPVPPSSVVPLPAAYHLPQYLHSSSPAPPQQLTVPPSALPAAHQSPQHPPSPGNQIAQQHRPKRDTHTHTHPQEQNRSPGGGVVPPVPSSPSQSPAHPALELPVPPVGGGGGGSAEGAGARPGAGARGAPPGRRSRAGACCHAGLWLLMELGAQGKTSPGFPPKNGFWGLLGWFLFPHPVPEAAAGGKNEALGTRSGGVGSVGREVVACPHVAPQPGGAAGVYLHRADNGPFMGTGTRWLRAPGGG